jgi:hypothetical protein
MIMKLVTKFKGQEKKIIATVRDKTERPISDVGPARSLA